VSTVPVRTRIPTKRERLIVITPASAPAAMPRAAQIAILWVFVTLNSLN
jgi:hypothetical protein